MENRQRHRFRRQIACEVAAGDSHVPGVVLDVSESGLFVETQARPTPNSIIRLFMVATGDQPRICIEAGVARAHPLQAGIEVVAAAGIGLEVLPPRTAFERWLASTAPPKESSMNLVLAPLGSQPHGRRGKYRVRLIRQDRPGTQIVTLEC